jgi:predicted regulator of Ras-like GTPase activity (Roadblock/LC7/MglB family)
MEPLNGGSGRSRQKWLGSLRDIEGILGSFFVSAEGDVLETDFPPAFQGIASGVGQRVARLRDALSLEGSQVATLTVRYPHHKLALRSVSGGALVVLAVATVNDAALRSAMHLVGQRCADIDVHSFAPSPPTAQEPSNQPSSGERPGVNSYPPEAGLPQASRKPRSVLFRGKRIG